MAPRARAQLMHAAHALMLQRQDLIVQTMTLESGKPLTEARAEFLLSAEFFQWFAEQVAHVHGTYASSSNGGFRVVVGHAPVGTVPPDHSMELSAADDRPEGRCGSGRGLHRGLPRPHRKPAHLRRLRAGAAGRGLSPRRGELASHPQFGGDLGAASGRSAPEKISFTGSTGWGACF